ncbi:MAG: carboxypeptidase regulatory-like domain-containing protein [Anaerolineae bacterium]|nr:carboxypeptidase regulatory-like domain-containing protein [Anaerolineae bacterium]
MQRNIVWIIIGLLTVCLLLLVLFWVGWSLFSSPPGPTPTLFLDTATAAPPAGSPAPASLTPAAAETLTPSATAPGFTPSATPQPAAVTPTPIPPSTPTPPPTPRAVISSPTGFVNVRSGPGLAYNPPLGAYRNGTAVNVLGRQYAADGALWWLIVFPAGPYGQGWVYANYTQAQNVANVPWITAPPTPTPVFVTPTPLPRPHAIINSPDGFLYVRSGPGPVYPLLGGYNNGLVVDVIGKQAAANGALWWLIPFANSPNRQGWIYADYTIAKYVEQVPWAPAPPTPTPSVIPTPTPTRTPSAPPLVNWTITGRVVNATSTARPVAGASVEARLGNDGTYRSAITDGNGYFSIAAHARDEGNLILTIVAPGYTAETITAGPAWPRVYDFPIIELAPQQAPPVSWVIFGRVVEIGTTQPIPQAVVKAFLGDEAVYLETLTGANGEFSLNGQARDSGFLQLNITAEGYQPLSFTSPQTDSRVYNLADLPLTPLAGSCAYESVLDLPQTPALARLQSLNFTNVVTTPVSVGGNTNLLGIVLTQTPDPPPVGQSIQVSCQYPIGLGVGVE